MPTGGFEINNLLRTRRFAYVHVNHPEFAEQYFWAAITDQPITEYRYVSNSETMQRIDVPEIISRPVWETRKVLTSPVDIHVMATRRVLVTLVYGQENQPVKNARISATSTVESRFDCRERRNRRTGKSRAEFAARHLSTGGLSAA